MPGLSLRTSAIDPKRPLRDLIIEVYVTHACDPAQITHNKPRGVFAIEIDLRKHDRTIDRTALPDIQKGQVLTGAKV